MLALPDTGYMILLAQMPKHDYVFVDESGDAGYTLGEAGALLSSSYYVAAALHVCDDVFEQLNSHVAAFRYYSGLSHELKLPPEKEVFGRLMGPISFIATNGMNIWSSAVYLDKASYTGQYLKFGGHRPQDSAQFRNYILRCLLVFHFKMHPLVTGQWDLVLDRFPLTKLQTENLQNYLAGNYNIPTPTHITHAASIYVEALQVVHHIAAGFKDVVSGGTIHPTLKFVSCRDITTNQFVYP